MKLYLHYEVDGDDKTTTKLTVPKSWYSKAVISIIGLFCESYNKKHVDAPLSADHIHLADNDGTQIYSDSIINEVLQEHGDYFIKHGIHMKSKAEVLIDSEVSLLRCKNYGCGAKYLNDENHEGVCTHHVLPPVFHDTIKFWGCCKDRKAYDWDEFQAIPGCCAGKHSTVDPKIALGSFRTTEEKVETPPTVLKSISDYNKANPDAVSAASSAVKVLAPAARKSTRNESDGTAKCRNKGCQATFLVAENNASACVFHAGQAVFHDTLKFWSCCPDKKCYEFEDFMRVPGCVRGCHDDGVVDLPEDHGKVSS